MCSPEEFAGRFVSLYVAGSGGSYGVRLSAPGIDPVVVGRTANPAVARQRLEAARRFVAAAVREAQTEVEVAEVTGEFLTELLEPSTG
ncbi:MAG TPA: hypothetical protein VM533_10105, partial [Fimbriiglobus sp.]|nr:hypothetical protein [Fimbriiglobus sp.]